MTKDGIFLEGLVAGASFFAEVGFEEAREARNNQALSVETTNDSGCPAFVGRQKLARIG